jgi:hypothetical protein
MLNLHTLEIGSPAPGILGEARAHPIPLTHLSRIKELRFHFVDIDSRLMEELTTSCPHLEALFFNSCSLRYLDLYLMLIKRKEVHSRPILNQVDFNFRIHPSRQDRTLLRGCLAAVKVVILNILTRDPQSLILSKDFTEEGDDKESNSETFGFDGLN